MVKQDAKDMSARAQLLLRVDREKGHVQSKRKSDFLIGTHDWTKLAIKVEIREDDVVALRLGLTASGETETYFDDIKVTVLETGQELPVKDFGAEGATFYPKASEGWYFPVSVEQAGYIPEVSQKHAYEGLSSFLIKSNREGFVDLSQPGEKFKFTTRSGTAMSFPTALYADIEEYKTHPAASEDKSDFYTLRPKGYLHDAEDFYSRLAILTDLYAYLKHFGEDLYMYSNLDSYYKSALEKINEKMTREEFERVLADLTNKFKAPNLNIFKTEGRMKLYSLPFRTVITDEGTLMISQSIDSIQIPVGSKITEVEGKKINEFLYPGNSPFSNFLNDKKFGEYRVGFEGSNAEITIETPGGEKKKLDLKRDTHLQDILESRPPIFHAFNDSTVYIDLTAITDKLLMENKAMLEKYKHIIFDCRGKIDVSPHAFGLFIEEPVVGFSWAFSEYTDPYNRKLNTRNYTMNIKGYNALPGKELYVLIDHRTVGLASEFAMTAKLHGLATIIGRSAQVSAEETIYYALPGDYNLSFTPGAARLPNSENALIQTIEPDIRVNFAETNATRPVPIIESVLKTIQSNIIYPKTDYKKAR
jgi:C-terminal processing protease CtpA/Prc